MEFDALDTIFQEEVVRVSKEEVRVEDTYEDIYKWHNRIIREYEYLFIIGMKCDHTVRNDFNMRNRRGSIWKVGVFEITRYMELLKCFGRISDIRFSMAVECDSHNKGRFEYDNQSAYLMGNAYNSLYINIGFTPTTTMQKWLCYFSYLTDLANRRKFNANSDIFRRNDNRLYKKDINHTFSEYVYKNIVRELTSKTNQYFIMLNFLTGKLHLTEIQAVSIADVLIQKLKEHGHT